MILLLTVATLVALTEQCQETKIIAEDGSVVIGRSMEFAIVETYLVTEPAGTQHVMPTLPNCKEPFRFESKYHSLKVRWKQGEDNWSKGDYDGMNSEGLSFAILYFPEYGVFPEPEEVTGDQCNNAIPHIRLGEYILGTFASVQEIRDAIDSDEFPMLYMITDLADIKHPIHYEFIDSTGEAMVLEYTKLFGRKTHNNTVGVFTNMPPFDWQMENLRNYPQLRDYNREGYKWEFKGEKFMLNAGTGSGLMGMPGDYTSPSRFVKAATLLKSSDKPKNRNQALVQCFHLMNAADIPVGVVKIPTEETSGKKKKDKKNKKNKKDREEDEEEGPKWLEDATSVMVMKSLQEGCLYIRTYVDVSLRRICFDNMPMDGSKTKRLEGKWRNSFKNLETDDMVDFDFDETAH